MEIPNCNVPKVTEKMESLRLTTFTVKETAEPAENVTTDLSITVSNKPDNPDSTKPESKPDIQSSGLLVNPFTSITFAIAVLLFF